MKQSDRRNFLGKSMAIAGAAAVTANSAKAQDKPVKKVIYRDGKKPEKAPLFNSTVTFGNLLFIAGKAPLPENGKLPKGRLGREFTAEEGYRFARSAAIDLSTVYSTGTTILSDTTAVVAPFWEWPRRSDPPGFGSREDGRRA